MPKKPDSPDRAQVRLADQTVERGAGGETHQTADGETPVLTTAQGAFCTQNVVPGVDFSNDPLLQGRNFSYLDTQLKRLGSPNFTQLPINAPKCPVHTLQQDGHMTSRNPAGRANYEPNSWGGAGGGPREAPQLGFQSVTAEERGPKVRHRGRCRCRGAAHLALESVRPLMPAATRLGARP